VTPVSLAAILISLAAIGFAARQLTMARLPLAVLLMIVHLAASLYYYQYSETTVSDAHGYYFESYIWGGQAFGLGTIAVVRFVQFLKDALQASYLDCFLLFQSFGFGGIVLLIRIFDEIEAKIGVSQRRGYLFILFLPSVNFWTAAIGKDAPIFFAICLSLWAMLDLRKRYIYFGLALALMVVVRAHIALMAAAALAGAAFFERSITLGRKAGLLSVALICVSFLAGAVQNTLDVDVTSTSSVSAFLEKQNGIYENVGGTTSLGSASFPVRLFSLLFRPLFFDSLGMMGLVASIENVAVIFAFLYMLIRWRNLVFLTRRVLFFRFAVIFAAMILISLSLVYYNVGLGLRQRVMAYPMVFSMLVALWAYRRKGKTAAAPNIPRDLMLGPDRNRPVPEL
jgi:hypothetical protein